MNLRLIRFLYAAVRRLPPEELEAMVLDAEKTEAGEKYNRATKKEFEDQSSVVRAKKIAEKLLKKKASERLRKHLIHSRSKRAE